MAAGGGVDAFGAAPCIGALPGSGITVDNMVGAEPTEWLQP